MLARAQQADKVHVSPQLSVLAELPACLELPLPFAPLPDSFGVETQFLGHNA